MVRVDVETRPPTSSDALRARADAIGDLARLLEQAPQDADLLRQLEDDVGLLGVRLHPDAADAVEDIPLRRTLDGDYPALIREAAPWLLARLAADES